MEQLVTLNPDRVSAHTRLVPGPWQTERTCTAMSLRTRVLIAEDDPGGRALLERFLALRNFDTVSVADGPSVLSEVRSHDYDAIVLDVEMPGLDGLEVLERLRREHSIPIIVLTCRTEEEHRLAGFAAGADDYVCKPYSLPELEARIRAVIKRGATASPPCPLVVDELVIDPDSATVTISGSPVSLTHKEFELLAFLTARRGRPHSRTELLHHVWGSTAEWQDPATVTEHVRRLRAKLERDPRRPKLIETVRGFGYRVAPASVEEVSDDDPA
jgi:DNA-binding response OmpR family regulator